MPAVFNISTVFIIRTVTFQDTVLAAVPGVLRRPTQSIVGQNRAYRVTHEADLPGKPFAFVALDKIMIHLISAHHYARHCILIVRTWACQQRNSADRYGIMRDLRSIHAWGWNVETVRTQAIKSNKIIF